MGTALSSLPVRRNVSDRRCVQREGCDAAVVDRELVAVRQFAQSRVALALCQSRLRHVGRLFRLEDRPHGVPLSPPALQPLGSRAAWALRPRQPGLILSRHRNRPGVPNRRGGRRCQCPGVACSVRGCCAFAAATRDGCVPGSLGPGFLF